MRLIVRGLDVLEVGSGRGGGADYVKRCLKPRTMTGVDFSKNAVAFSNRRYAAEGGWQTCAVSR